MTPPVSSPAIKIVKSVREQVSPEEWQTRVDLAACYRLTALYGMTEMIANHISCRVPGSPDHFLINPYGMLYEEIDASCLIKVDLDGNTLFNASDYGVNAAGFVIHSAIHMARHDVDCVAHTHTPAGMAVSAMECGLLPLAQTSMRFLHVAYHDFEGIADDVGERERWWPTSAITKPWFCATTDCWWSGGPSRRHSMCCGAWNAPARCRSWRFPATPSWSSHRRTCWNRPTTK
jgi:hypothetical protein